MYLEMSQQEIQKAIKYYLDNTTEAFKNMGMNIEFTARRKGKGITASVTTKGLEIPGFNYEEHDIDDTDKSTSEDSVITTVSTTGPVETSYTTTVKSLF